MENDDVLIDDQQPNDNDSSDTSGTPEDNNNTTHRMDVDAINWTGGRNIANNNNVQEVYAGYMGDHYLIDENNNRTNRMHTLNIASEVEITHDSNINETQTENSGNVEENHETIISNEIDVVNLVNESDSGIEEIEPVNKITEKEATKKVSKDHNDNGSDAQEVMNDEVQIIKEVIKNPKVVLRAFSYSRYDTDSERITRLRASGMVVLPNLAFHPLKPSEISLPLCVKVRSVKTRRFTHCGIIEFCAPEGEVFLPDWVMKQCEITDGAKVLVEQAFLPVATSVMMEAMTPLTHVFRQPRDVLQLVIRNYDFVTVNDLITIHYEGHEFRIMVRSVRPDWGGMIADRAAMSLTHIWTPIKAVEKQLKQHKLKCVTFIGPPMPPELARSYTGKTMKAALFDRGCLPDISPSEYPVLDDKEVRNDNEKNDEQSTSSSCSSKKIVSGQKQKVGKTAANQPAPFSETIGKSLAMSVLF